MPAAMILGRALATKQVIASHWLSISATSRTLLSSEIDWMSAMVRPTFFRKVGRKGYSPEVRVEPTFLPLRSAGALIANSGRTATPIVVS